MSVTEYLALPGHPDVDLDLDLDLHDMHLCALVIADSHVIVDATGGHGPWSSPSGTMIDVDNVGAMEFTFR